MITKERKIQEIKKLKTAEEVIKKIENYTYEYSDKKINPILIVGPAGDDTDLRIYAYGGKIGKIATESKRHCKLAFGKDKDKAYSYGKYLIDGYCDDKKIKFEHKSVPELDRLWNKEQEKKWEEKVENLYDIFEILAEKCTSQAEKMEMLGSKNYLDLIVSAAYTKFMHREKDKQGETVLRGLSERSKQTLIAKQSQSQKWDKKQKNMVVVDIECNIPLHYKNENDKRKRWDEKKKEYVYKENAKIDFVVFDGEAFGLIEFKYQGESMKKGTANSLEEHYKDFQQIVCEDDTSNKVDLIIELIRRMDYLVTYGIIDISWEEPLRKMEKKIIAMSLEEYDPAMLWYGFYFVGGDKEDIKDIKEDIEAEMEKQGLPNNIKYQIDADLDNNIIHM